MMNYFTKGKHNRSFIIVIHLNSEVSLTERKEIENAKKKKIAGIEKKKGEQNGTNKRCGNHGQTITISDRQVCPTLFGCLVFRPEERELTIE
ncbi:hypothetical protein RHGRI_004583 [Rhododendron griersonianum]|uniref:Uncharacterized protein n=1 Tax=Rhododendron griersonianum TaxID=479676 RepID=A0AAV6L966_9ERIC|nr:hypothetical protein RHGRI_004583 [Rhododendron griersonianum]